MVRDSHYSQRTEILGTSWSTSKFHLGSEILFKMCGCTLAALLLETADLEASDCLEVLAADHFFFRLVTGFKVIVTLLCKDPFSTYLATFPNLFYILS